ncbi:hypothetical protein OFN51_34410, partial [Escherichia coli]|nr:hypothetical protein [Escherichia coli]
MMMAYGGEHGSIEMLKAAKFKGERLKEKYKNNEVLIESYTDVKSFKDIWTRLYRKTLEKTKSNTLVYELYEMHLFGHSRG